MDSGVPAPSRARWFGVGYSASPDAGVAAAEATDAALAGRSARLLIVFCSVGYDLPRLLDGVRVRAGDAAIVGCTTLGQLASVLPDPGADGVVVDALGGEGFQVRTRVSRDASSQRRQAGMQAGGAITELDRAHRVCLLLCDGLVGEQHEIVRGAYAVVGAEVPLVGGCAGDDLTYSRTYQFHGDRGGVEVLSDAVVGVAIGSDTPLGIGIAHGWRKRGEPMNVTSSSGGRLFELDHEPALDVYLRRIGADRSLVEDLDTFRRAVFASPLGLSRRSGEDIRVIHSGDLSDGSLECLADVPQGALAWLMEADDQSLVAGAKESMAQAVTGLGETEPIGVMAFDCGARKVMLGQDGMREEAAAMTSVLGDTPFGGFYTYGEIARTNGARGMHHLTMVTLAIS